MEKVDAAIASLDPLTPGPSPARGGGGKDIHIHALGEGLQDEREAFERVPLAFRPADEQT